MKSEGMPQESIFNQRVPEDRALSSAARRQPCAACGPTVAPPGAPGLAVIDWMPLEWTVLLAGIGAPVTALLRRWDKFSWAALALVCGGLAYALIGFHGDMWESFEMQRHAFIGSILFRLGCTLLWLGAVGALLRRMRLRAD
jgi:hypothetical protein